MWLRMRSSWLDLPARLVAHSLEERGLASYMPSCPLSACLSPYSCLPPESNVSWSRALKLCRGRPAWEQPPDFPFFWFSSYPLPWEGGDKGRRSTRVKKGEDLCQVWAALPAGRNKQIADLLKFVFSFRHPCCFFTNCTKFECPTCHLKVNTLFSLKWEKEKMKVKVSFFFEGENVREQLSLQHIHIRWQFYWIN